MFLLKFWMACLWEKMFELEIPHCFARMCLILFERTCNFLREIEYLFVLELEFLNL